jgi:hypothetical protein
VRNCRGLDRDSVNILPQWEGANSVAICFEGFNEGRDLHSTISGATKLEFIVHEG